LRIIAARLFLLFLLDYLNNLYGPGQPTTISGDLQRIAARWGYCSFALFNI
jgi:hypothetical protein